MAWYALYTRPRHEKKVHDSLIEKDIETFLPLKKEMRRWKDRRKLVEMPLFNGYVFINIELKNRLDALQTHGVVRMISFGGEPAQIPDWQIEQLKRVIANSESLQPEEYLKVGDFVEVTDGPLAGIRGYLRETRGESRIAILIDGIYQSTSFVVDKSIVRKVEPEDDSKEKGARA
jgi:transcription elongation factor/antiterminator RfaH